MDKDDLNGVIFLIVWLIFCLWIAIPSTSTHYSDNNSGYSEPEGYYPGDEYFNY